MSDDTDAVDDLDVTDLDERFTGSDRYIATAERFLDVDLTVLQRRVFRAVAENQRVHVQSGNGVGKSFAAAVLNLAFLVRHPESIAMATSGTYSVLSDVLWKPMRRLHRRSELPGRALESPPRIELADEWYFKAVSPRHPGDLEGRHAGTMLVTIEEIDKPDITAEHFDSAESMLTGPDDRILAIGNPPKDESNVAHTLLESDRWHSVQFSSFDSHNVRVDAGDTRRSNDRIGGLVGLETLKDDWRNWNDEEWPGLETARTAHQRRDSLDQRWYRRRAGVMPPSGAAAHRPFHVADVEAASERVPESAPSSPDAVGIDVARSGDRTVMVGVHGDDLRVHYAKRGTDHTTQESRLRSYLDGWPSGIEIAIDAVGEGSGLADNLDRAYRNVTRFKAGATANAETQYADCWSEALGLLGDVLADGGAVADSTLREELLVAARTISYEERHLASRGTDGATILDATEKGAVTERLGHSPDYLDAAAMAVWARDSSSGINTDELWTTSV